jgi:twitching motility protein PilT
MPPGDLVPAWHGERGNLVETFGFYGEADAEPGVVEPQHPAAAPAGSAYPAPGLLPAPDPLTDPYPDQVDALSQYAMTPAATAAAALLPSALQPSALQPLVASSPAPDAVSYGPPAGQPVEEWPEPALAPADEPFAAEIPTLPLPVAALGVAISEADVNTLAGTMREELMPAVEGLSLTDMLVRVMDRGASDLHLTAGARPTIRHNGSLEPLEDLPVMTPPVIQQMMYQVLTQKQRERFEEVLELDFAYAVPGRARFRVNLYRQRESLGAAFRLIPFEIKPLEALGVPPAVANFAMMPRGFVLVTGPTGSGKSTTLASIIDLANRQRRDHIMTVEDPIEFLHQHKSCLINQREVGDDTHSFTNALKHVLRQDPDIIMVGEMRDLETISVALTAAETGHLVFATLHTQDAAQTIDRVIDVFPPHQQQQVRVQLAGSLQGVVSQTLCKSADGRGRVVATEVLVATPAIRNLIREGKTHQIYSALQAGARHGMHTMDQHLSELVKAGRIRYETGVEKCHHIEDFSRLCGRG